MKIFFSYSENSRTHLKSFELAEGSTVDELLKIDDVRQVIESQNEDYKIGVNGEILDGKFFPVPKKYRLQEGERVEIYNALKVDPKDNRKKRAL
ncbi:MAG: RnfH family protein [Gammaproteobacteria bacterium]|jgi:putative ubiquitin-RnfH superfamily antitoxin RatB of RatAB toxin-antitoxin module|tara:strand:- start:340 stop:621 length:282 start_codon:yes stop_codon:yes gene_type:complete